MLRVLLLFVAATAVLVFACRQFAPLYEIHTPNKGVTLIETTDRTAWAMKMAAKILFVVGVVLAASGAILQVCGVTVP
jgi:uncharacterized membrane protein YjfL (UPF0719 family)